MQNTKRYYVFEVSVEEKGSLQNSARVLSDKLYKTVIFYYRK